MLSHLADVSVRSVLLALVAAIVLLFLRHRRTAALQHAVWTGVVSGTLALLAFGTALPRLPLRILHIEAEAIVQSDSTPIEGPSVFDGLADVRPIKSRAASMRLTPISWRDVALGLYAVIAALFLVRLLTGLLLVRRLIANSTRVGNFRESELISVPVTAGWMRPAVLLPPEWRAWDEEKLNAVLTHESAHVRRRDGLVALLAGLNRCLFWFHPLAWILEGRLALLAEQACDEATVAATGNREGYARLLLEMASAVVVSRGRLRRHVLTMAAASHIRQRVEYLLERKRAFSQGLSWAGWAMLAVCGIPVVLGAGSVDIDRQPPLSRLEISPWLVPARPVLKLGPKLVAQAQSAPKAAPAPALKFDAAAIRRCMPGDEFNGTGGRGGGGGRGPRPAPGRLTIQCMDLASMIDMAYFTNATERPADFFKKAPMEPMERLSRGGPAWIYSDWYTIEAETDDPEANGPMNGMASPAEKRLMGPLLRALLEDRFRLKLHTAVEEAPIYALTVARGGLKILPIEEGACTPFSGSGPITLPKPGEKPMCGANVSDWKGPNRIWDETGVTLATFASFVLSSTMDRRVVDRTGVTGRFTFHFEYLPDDTTPVRFGRQPDPASDIPVGPTVFSALEQQLGLKLVPDKGKRGYFVIDHVERPSEN